MNNRRSSAADFAVLFMCNLQLNKFCYLQFWQNHRRGFIRKKLLEEKCKCKLIISTTDRHFTSFHIPVIWEFLFKSLVFLVLLLIFIDIKNLPKILDHRRFIRRRGWLEEMWKLATLVPVRALLVLSALIYLSLAFS